MLLFPSSQPGFVANTQTGGVILREVEGLRGGVLEGRIVGNLVGKIIVGPSEGNLDGEEDGEIGNVGAWEVGGWGVRDEINHSYLP